MSRTIVFPSIGDGTQSRLVSHLRRPGDGVDVGDPLVYVDVAGRHVTIHSDVNGMVMKHYRSPGQALAAGSPLLEISTSAAPITNKIFISYRWADEPHVAGRLVERLRSEFGRFQVFFDNVSLQAGDDIDVQIDRALDRAEVFVLIIGPNWLTPRLVAEDDRHRREVATALRRAIPVFPVLVGAARLPDPVELPDDVRRVTNFVGTRVAHENWDDAVHKVTSAIAERLDINGFQHAQRWNLPDH